MPAHDQYPIPFWTLTPRRLWSMAGAVGLFVACLAWVKVKQCANLPVATFVFLVTAIVVVLHIHHVWELVLVIDHYPAKLETIPASVIADIPAPRWKYALVRLPLALLASLIPYLVLALAWRMFTF